LEPEIRNNLFVFRMIIRKISFFVFIAVACSCEQELQEPVKPKVEFKLKRVDISNSIAVVMNNDYTSEKLYKIDANRKISLATLTFEGDSIEQGKGFDLYDINVNYFLLTSDSLKQTYFIDKSDGAAHKSVYLQSPYFWNAGQVACSKEACYINRYNDTMIRINNYLSENATMEVLPINDVNFVSFDIDGTIIYVKGYSSINTYIDGNSEELVQDYTGLWQDSDGYFRVMKTSGNIYKIKKNELTFESYIPYPISYVRAFTFPELNKTLGFEYKKDEYHLYDLKWVYHNVYPGPTPIEYSPEFNVLTAKAGKYIYVLANSKRIYQTFRNYYLGIRKINAIDLSSTLITTKGDSYVNSFMALTEDILIAVICVHSVDELSCVEQLAFIRQDGEIEFLFKRGFTSGDIVKL